MCLHKWKYYKDKEVNKYYRICTKCGVAQEGRKYSSLSELLEEKWHLIYETNKTLCRTNNWIDRETWRLRYGN